ncbi:DUF1836 domain-containing protein [Virgibacillus soli]|uniref:DUF1836 domain-containing protein n=1 Tax=Paracerasibacillus soli TaxID=480284 RepID=A0ABU5CR66_9BACI|nr:DUF1836 domain-containing protein [Virgibacillus soli]MDY0408834.1 DUF1836 domain-containing protein [Virgibacillus soli]
MENKISEIIALLDLDNKLTLEEIPDIDLYMDQVIQLFENKYAETKRNDEEKILTKTMINNYAKGRLFFPIKNKKYTKQHVLLISLIYQLKGALSINDIKKILDQLNEKIVNDQFQLDNFYESYMQLLDVNAKNFKIDVEDCAKDVTNEIAQYADEDATYLEKLLLITSLVNMSNFYRRAAELLVDKIENSKSDKPD